METAIIKQPVVSVRDKPSQQAALTDEVLHGMTVNVLSQTDGFAYIRTHYGYEGYIEGAALAAAGHGYCLCTEETEHPPHVIRHAAVDVLEAPRVQAQRLVCLPRGAFIMCGETLEGGWTEVRLADGRAGFLRTAHAGDVIKRAEDAQARRSAIINTALSYMGTQYRWGGKTPEGIDCSGLCSMAYMLNGILICRDARLDAGFPVLAIPFTEAKEADLLYFPGHIAMLLSGMCFIHATASGNGVRINSLDPSENNYRNDLAQSLLFAGTI